MRVEAQGRLEAQPPFQHVGYVSGAPKPGVDVSVGRAGSGLLLMAVGVVLICRAVHREGHIWPAVAALVLGLAVLVASGIPRRPVTPKVGTATAPAPPSAWHDSPGRDAK